MVLVSVVFSFLLFLISFVIGRRVLKLFRFSFSTLLEEFVFSTGVGLGIISYLILALGLMGLLYKWVYLLFFGILFCFTLYEIWKSKFFLRINWQKLHIIFSAKPKTYFEYGLLIIPFMYILLSLLVALAPSTDWDSLTYHLAIPKIWIQNHRIIHIPYIFQSEYHLTTETLYTMGMALTSDISARLIIWMSSILFILTIFSFCRRYLSIKVGILGAAAFCCMPLFSAINTKAMVDIPVGYYAFLGLYALFNYKEKNDYKTLILMGITTGFAAATKHTGLIYAFLLFIAFLILEIKRNRFGMVSFKHVILLGIVILLIPAPWYIRCFINTGGFISTWHPVSNVVGGSGAQEELPSFIISRVFEYIIKVVTNFLKYVLIEMLFRRTYSGTLWGIGPFILAFVPCLALVRGVDKAIKLILIYSVSGLFLFSIMSEEVRLSVSLFASLSIAGAYAVFWLLDNYKPLVKFIRIIILACFLLNIIPLANLTFKALPVVSGLETKEHYLNRMIRMYDVVEYANNNLGDDVKILSMDSRGYYFDKPYITTNIATNDVIESMPDLLEILKKEKVTHLFCNENYSNTGYRPLPEDLRSHIKLIYSNNNCYLYELDWYNS